MMLSCKQLPSPSSRATAAITTHPIGLPPCAKMDDNPRESLVLPGWTGFQWILAVLGVTARRQRRDDKQETPDILLSHDMPVEAESLETPPPQCPGASSEVKRQDADQAPPMTIKQILAQLGGVFPMDEAVVDGSDPNGGSRS